jgi:hypothetical protein
VQGAGCRVQGAGCRVQGAGCRVQGAGCREQGAGCRVQGAGCRVQGAGCRVQGAGCRVQGAGCRVQGAALKGSQFRSTDHEFKNLEGLQRSRSREYRVGVEDAAQDGAEVGVLKVSARHLSGPRRIFRV